MNDEMDTNPVSVPSDQDSLKQIQARVKPILAALQDLSKLTIKEAELPVLLRALARKLQDAPSLAATLASVGDDAMALGTSMKVAREAGFGRIFAEFIKSQREAGTPLREISESNWRVGAITIETDPPTARARACYAHKPVLDWRTVNTKPDLDAMMSDAHSQLRAVEIPEDELGPVFREAYDFAALETARAAKDGRRVRLVDLRREVHLALLRRELRKDPDRKLGKGHFPTWAFAYNADRYRRIHRDLPSQYRLAFETGSQLDQKAGLAVTLNGLDPLSEHRTYCYAELMPAERGE